MEPIILKEPIQNQLSKIPKAIFDDYGFDIGEKCINVHAMGMCYINIDFDDMFSVEERECVIAIINSKIHISFWKRVKNIHITVY